MIDAAEDPEKMVDEYLRQMRSELSEARAATAMAMADETRPADGSMDKMEGKADERLAKAQAMAELTSQDLDTRFSDLESQNQVETDLADLKKQMGKK